MKDRPVKYHPLISLALPGILLFIISFIWFYFPGEYVLIANRDLSLFITTPGYLLSFLDHPGGLLEYAGSFLNQFYRFRIAGALVLSGIITFAYFVSKCLMVRISGQKEFFLIGLLAAVLLIGMHNYYPHQIAQSLGFILSMGLVALVPSSGLPRIRFLILVVPLFYLLAGGFIWVFCGLVMASYLPRPAKRDIPSLLLISLYPIVLVLSFARLLFLDSLSLLAVRPLPFGEAYGTSPWPWLFIGWIILSVILARRPLRILKLSPAWRTVVQSSVCLIGLLLVLHFSFNRKNRELFHIEKLALSRDWDELLSYTTEHPSRNLFGAFYTNMALANSGKLCAELFRYPQSFGRRGLCFEWDAKGEILRRGSDFFWTVHFVNEAHHWAFESMVIDGFTNRNLTRLIQTELVRGNHRVAEKYVDLLGSALFHKKIAKHYARFLNDREAILNDPELGPRTKIHLKQDFFAEGMDLELNLRSLLANNPSNLPAYEYLMALLLLEKEVDKIAAAMPGYLQANEGKLPSLLDESILVYKITHREEDTSQFSVSPISLQRFEAYTGILRQYRDQNEAARALYPTYGSSFWFYLNFVPLPNL